MGFVAAWSRGDGVAHGVLDLLTLFSMGACALDSVALHR